MLPIQLQSREKCFMYIALLFTCFAQATQLPQSVPGKASVEKKTELSGVSLLDSLRRSVPLQAGIRELVDANTAFAWDLYRQCSPEGGGNMLISPYSISTALGMAYAGAAGETRRQMAMVLHFNRLSGAEYEAFGGLQTLFDVKNRSGSATLNIANSIWVQRDYPLLPSYLEIVTAKYLAAAAPLDFIAGPDAARRKINGWVLERTEGNIRELIPAGLIDNLTRVVLVNAVYFLGNWELPFSEKMTASMPFVVSETDTVLVPMMHRTAPYAYAANKKFQLLEMAYAGDDFSMRIVLPRMPYTVTDIEHVAETEIEALAKQLEVQDVSLGMPRFSMEWAIRLDSTLVRMGMADAFGDKADFSGQTGSRDLMITAVLHKACIDVFEKGTKASAATSVIEKEIGNWTTPRNFKVNRPFIVMIRDNTTGSILFLGRVVNPVVSGK